MESIELPCCGVVERRHLKDLPHLYGFDFDLFQCGRCARYWVYAWFNVGGWEKCTAEDAHRMQTLGQAELRVFVKGWARSFN